ncbi:MAG: dienelactone hydrolase family protein [Fusobacteria bacterium]|nr:dienelactone hydrolase family protein [Fusobacteriota bacterium]
MNVIRERLCGAPVMIVYKDLEVAKKKGCIFFYHGLTAKKEGNLKEFRELAQEGFLVIGVDVFYHGERKHPRYEEIFSEKNPEKRQFMLDAILLTIDELSFLIDELENRGWIKEGKIGVTGISMGGHMTYTAITKEKRVKVAVAVVGSPKYKFERPESPHLHQDRFNKVYLLSQTGGIDDVVPPDNAREFHEELEKEFSDSKERFLYIEYPNSGHGFLESDWEACMSQMKSWFNNHL